MNIRSEEVFKRVLEIQRHGLTQYLPAYLVERTELTAEVRQGILDDTAKTMLLKLTSSMLVDKLPPESFTETTWAEFETPDTWVQAWKAEHATWWGVRHWLAKHPVRLRTEKRRVTVTVSLSRQHGYPEWGWDDSGHGRVVAGFTRHPNVWEYGPISLGLQDADRE